jgi:hypothetical protein
MSGLARVPCFDEKQGIVIAEQGIAWNRAGADWAFSFHVNNIRLSLRAPACLGPRAIASAKADDASDTPLAS